MELMTLGYGREHCSTKNKEITENTDTKRNDWMTRNETGGCEYATRLQECINSEKENTKKWRKIKEKARSE